MQLFLNKKKFHKFLLIFLLVAICLIWKISYYSTNLNEVKLLEQQENKYVESHENVERFEIIERLTKNVQDEKYDIRHEDILNGIWNVSDEQILMDPKIIMMTIKFMIEEREEDDPELIEFVRSLIVLPPLANSDRKLNLKNKNKYKMSQTDQSIYIDEFLRKKKNGFFVEAGGHEGEDTSNSLFFELERNWTGLLIEPIPSFYSAILAKNRNIFALNACIANKRPLLTKFRIHFSLSGRLSEMHEKHQKRMDRESGTAIPKIAYIPCFSFFTIMKAMQVYHVDYFSLDVEGGELDILKNIDFNKIDVNTLTVEHNGFEDVKQDINRLMLSKGYKLAKEDGSDGYFIKTYS